MKFAQDINPTAKAGRTNAQNYNQGITYNEVGVTYNDSRYAYGGVYENEVIGFIVSGGNAPIIIQVQRTNVQLSNDGISYNQAGVSYNDVRYTYGGVYGNDILPMVAKAEDIKTNIILSRDIYIAGGTITPPGNSGMLIGILGLTYS